MSSEAATNINKATLPTASTTSLSATVSAPTKPDAVSDAVKLVQAQNLNQIGANVIERSNNMTGTLLNISV